VDRGEEAASFPSSSEGAPSTYEERLASAYVNRALQEASVTNAAIVPFGKAVVTMSAIAAVVFLETLGLSHGIDGYSLPIAIAGICGLAGYHVALIPKTGGR
jgi:hypothetical protein